MKEKRFPHVAQITVSEPVNVKIMVTDFNKFLNA
jgi:hypothetical protein